MIRVAVTGSECTGKTTLARALAEHYGTVWVPEFVREFVEQKGAAPVLADVESIARGQAALEDEMTDRANRLLILDTDLLSTVIYSEHYYGSCPASVEQTVADRPADLYLLCDIDVPWSPDGEQRDRGDRRQELQALFRDAMIQRALNFVEVSGSPRDRMRIARRALNGRFARSLEPPRRR